MKANLKQKTDQAMSFTEMVTTRWDSRITGSQACLECGNYLLECFDEFCDTTRMHKFDVRPSAFFGFLKIAVVFYFLALITLWTQFLGLATILATAPVIVTVFQFFFYKDFISFLYPKKEGQNVVGSIEPEGEVKQQIIISAHHDSAHIFNFLVDDPAGFPRKMQIANAASFGIAIAAWALFIGELLGFSLVTPTYVVAGFFTLLSYNVGQLWFFYDEKGTPGAGDNMVCTALAMEVGKHFAQQKKNGQGLKYTRVVVASWDAEEAGLRGARAYLKAYLPELEAVKTYNFNLECMYDYKELGFLTSDLNAFVQLSESMVDECIEVGNSLGYAIKKNPFPFLAGGTDAAEFAKAGIEATTLAAMNWIDKDGMPAYHTPRDTIEAVDAVAVSRSIELGIQYILKKEEDVQ